MKPLLLALLLTGCTSVAVGPVYVASQELGYESPYWGGKAEGRAEHGKLRGVAQGTNYDSHKLETGDGHGARARALGGLEVGHGVSLLAGVTYSRQETSAWVKEGYAPTVQVEYLAPKLGTLMGSVERLDDSDDEQWVGALELRLQRFPIFARYEYVDYKTLFAEGDGRRYEIGLLIPLWRR